MSMKKKTAAKAATISTVNKNVRTTTTKALKTITHQDIAERAYTIYLSGRGGNSTEHWLQAERELRSENNR